MPHRLILRSSLLAVVLALCSSVTWTGGDAERSTTEKPSALRVTRGLAAGLEYLVVEPADLPPDAELPMIVSIHGRGDRPRAPEGSVFGLDRPVRLILPRAPDRYGKGYAWMPVSAHSGESEPLVAALDARERMLASALGELRRRYPTRGKPIVVGFSQGGMLAMTLGVREPGAISHVIAMAGWIPPSLMPQAADPYSTYAPIDALHGAADPILDAERTRRVVDELRARGYEAGIELFPGIGHEVSGAMLERFRALLVRALDELPGSGASGAS